METANTIEETAPYLPYTNEPSAPRAIMAPERRRRGAAELFERARESRAGLAISLLMARWTINLAAEGEPDPEVRQRRKRLLTDRWHRYFNDIMSESIVWPRP